MKVVAFVVFLRVAAGYFYRSGIDTSSLITSETEFDRCPALTAESFAPSAPRLSTSKWIGRRRKVELEPKKTSKVFYAWQKLFVELFLKCLSDPKSGISASSTTKELLAQTLVTPLADASFQNFSKLLPELKPSTWKAIILCKALASRKALSAIAPSEHKMPNENA